MKVVILLVPIQYSDFNNELHTIPAGTSVLFDTATGFVHMDDFVIRISPEEYRVAA